MDKIMELLKEKGITHRIEDSLKMVYKIAPSDYDPTDALKICIAIESQDDEELFDAIFDFALTQIVNELNIKPKDEEVDDVVKDMFIDMLIRKVKKGE